MSAELKGRKGWVVALGLFVVLSLVFTYPLPLHLASAVEDRQDALLNVWITAWEGHQLLTRPLGLFEANIFYPYPRTLAYSELVMGNGLIALPITAASGNPVLGYNVAMLLSFVLSGLGTYLLVLKLTQRRGAALVGGLVFAFCSYRMSNLAQAQLLTTQWLPLALWALHGLMEQPSRRRAVLFVVFSWLQTVSSFYYGILLALTAAGVAACTLVWMAGRRRMSRHEVLRTGGRLLAAAGAVVVLVLPFVVPYVRVQREMGFERTLADSEPFSASLRQYALVPPGSVAHGLWLPSETQAQTGGYPVDALFPGLAAVALAVVGVVRGQGGRRWLYALLLVAAGCLSLGPRLYLAPGQPAGPGAALPYAWLYAVLPGFKAMRAPARFDALVMLALAVLAGYGLAAGQAWLAARKQRRHGAGRPIAGAILAAVVGGLVVIESLVWPGAKAEAVPVGGQVPAVYGWLAETAPGPILELPMAFTKGGPQLDYQYLSTYHWQTTPDGYSGFVPPKHGLIVYEMEWFPSERSIGVLQAMGVETVVVHLDRYPATRRAKLVDELKWAPEVTVGETLGNDLVVRVGGRAFSADNLRVNAYVPPRAAAGQPYSAYLVVTNLDSRSYALAPGRELGVVVSWQTGGSEDTTTVTAELPLVISLQGGVAVIPVQVVAPEAAGSYRLDVRADGPDGPLGDWQAEGEVQVGDSGDPDHPVPARLEAWEFPATVRAGQALAVRLEWRALGKIDSYYSVYVKLLDGQGQPVTGWDGQPVNGRAPTLEWQPKQRIEDTITLDVPAGTPPGEYTLEVGMYHAEDLARCLLMDGLVMVDRVVLGSVQVEP